MPGVAFAGEGMPQLNFANPLTVMQAAWLLVIFLALYLLLKSWGLPQVASVIEARAASIKSDLDAAHLARTKAEEAMAASAAATKQAHAEANARIATEVAGAKAEAAKAAAALDEALEVRLAEAEATIAAARAQAVGALHQVASETASNVVSRLLGVAPSPEAVAASVGQVIAARVA